MKRTIRLVLATAMAAGMGYGAASTFAAGPREGSPTPPLPLVKGDIIDVATGPGMTKVTTLVTALRAAGLVDALRATGPFTVFAPTNDAFGKMPADMVNDLLKPENKELLQKLLKYHVHSGGAISAAQLTAGKISTLNGKELTIAIEGPTVTVNAATITKTDINASNGVIHWIDTVLVPE